MAQPLKEVLLSTQSLLREDTCSRVISPNFTCLQGSWLPERALSPSPHTIHSTEKMGAFRTQCNWPILGTWFRMRLISPSSACFSLLTIKGICQIYLWPGKYHPWCWIQEKEMHKNAQNGTHSYHSHHVASKAFKTYRAEEALQLALIWS